jgi:hypothetical protein
MDLHHSSSCFVLVAVVVMGLAVDHSFVDDCYYPLVVFDCDGEKNFPLKLPQEFN